MKKHLYSYRPLDLTTIELDALKIDSSELSTRRRFLIGAGGLLGAAMLGACGAGEETVVSTESTTEDGYPRTITHMSGETMLVNRPTRIFDVSYFGTWFLASFNVTPIKYSSRSDRLNEFRSLAEAIGVEIDFVEFLDDDAINIESVVAAKPDLILGQVYHTEAVREELEAIAPVIDIPGNEDGDWRDRLRMIGDILGMTENAETVIAETEAKLAAAAAPFDLQDASFAYVIPGLYDGNVPICQDSAYGPVGVFSDAGLTMEPEIASLTGEVCTGVSLELLPETLQTTDLLVFVEFFSDTVSEEFLNNPIVAAMPAIEQERYVQFSGPTVQTTALDVYSPAVVDLVLPIIRETGKKYQSIREQ
ncbi:MAG: ABC transporter substrate-binding protein [Chloroflexota bacterium]